MKKERNGKEEFNIKWKRNEVIMLHNLPSFLQTSVLSEGENFEDLFISGFSCLFSLDPQTISHSFIYPFPNETYKSWQRSCDSKTICKFPSHSLCIFRCFPWRLNVVLVANKSDAYLIPRFVWLGRKCSTPKRMGRAQKNVFLIYFAYYNVSQTGKMPFIYHI